MSKIRNISFDEEDNYIYQKLRLNSLFKGLNLTDLFALAVIFGKIVGIRTQLGSGANARIRDSSFKNSDIDYLMMAIGVAEEDSLDILERDDEYITICEEYAKTGIQILSEKSVEYDFLDNLEMEILRYFDEYIEED